MLLMETLQKNGCQSHHQLTIGKKGLSEGAFQKPTLRYSRCSVSDRVSESGLNRMSPSLISKFLIPVLGLLIRGSDLYLPSTRVRTKTRTFAANVECIKKLFSITKSARGRPRKGERRKIQTKQGPSPKTSRAIKIGRKII